MRNRRHDNFMTDLYCVSLNRETLAPKGGLKNIDLLHRAEGKPSRPHSLSVSKSELRERIL